MHKRLMRGKLKVILNEGFKKLYGFGENSRKKTEWSKLIGILKYFIKSCLSIDRYIKELE